MFASKGMNHTYVSKCRGKTFAFKINKFLSPSLCQIYRLYPMFCASTTHFLSSIDQQTCDIPISWFTSVLQFHCCGFIEETYTCRNGYDSNRKSQWTIVNPQVCVCVLKYISSISGCISYSLYNYVWYTDIQYTS